MWLERVQCAAMVLLCVLATRVHITGSSTSADASWEHFEWIADLNTTRSLEVIKHVPLSWYSYRYQNDFRRKLGVLPTALSEEEWSDIALTVDQKASIDGRIHTFPHACIADTDKLFNYMLGALQQLNMSAAQLCTEVKGLESERDDFRCCSSLDASQRLR
jgi:hypothetical protein